MITTGMLKRQVWMADDFDHVAKNSQRVLRLYDQFENHPYTEEFTKGCSVCLYMEHTSKFCLDDTWNLFKGDHNTSNFCRQMINCMKAWDYLQKTSDILLNTRIVKQAHGLMTEDEKNVLEGNTESHLHLQAIIFLHQRAALKDTWKTQFLGFMKDYLIMAATNLFGNITFI